MIWRSDSAKSTFRNDGTLMMDIYISHTHAFIIYLFIYLFIFIFIIIFYIYFYLYLYICIFIYLQHIYTHRYVDKWETSGIQWGYFMGYHDMSIGGTNLGCDVFENRGHHLYMTISTGRMMKSTSGCLEHLIKSIGFVMYLWWKIPSGKLK